jgi:hypothetical protein
LALNTENKLHPSINTYLPPTTKPELIFEIATSASFLVLNIAYAFPTDKKPLVVKLQEPRRKIPVHH